MAKARGSLRSAARPPRSRTTARSRRRRDASAAQGPYWGGSQAGGRGCGAPARWAVKNRRVPAVAPARAMQPASVRCERGRALGGRGKESTRWGLAVDGDSAGLSEHSGCGRHRAAKFAARGRRHAGAATLQGAPRRCSSSGRTVRRPASRGYVGREVHSGVDCVVRHGKLGIALAATAALVVAGCGIGTSDRAPGGPADPLPASIAPRASLDGFPGYANVPLLLKRMQQWRGRARAG